MFEVIQSRLSDNPYLAGDYSIADIACFGWVRVFEFSGVSIEGLPHLNRWMETIAARPAVQRGLAIPTDEQKKVGAPWAAKIAE
ncbi:glutathione binding-like protein [Thalassobaculum sp.]|uniref:glutathione binding-like protein n=1 Tax=Thalassobaculum sp. TaxID=2022740 RepID=UPI0032EF70A1